MVKYYLGEDYEILERYKGKDLEGTEYEQLIPSLNLSLSPSKTYFPLKKFITGPLLKIFVN